MEELNQITLKIAVLDPTKTKNTYSFQQAEILQGLMRKYALKVGVALVISIESCRNHEEVIRKLDDPNTIALQPISNSSTGLVPYKVFETMISEIGNLEFYGALDLKIDNRLIAHPDKVDLLLEENYKDIDVVLTHSAPEGQCKKQIELINKANPDRELKVINTFNSTTSAVDALNSEEFIGKNVVAIGNMETANANKFEHTKTSWQDFPDDNFTTFLAIGNKNNVDWNLQKFLHAFTKIHSESDKIDFIASLPISDDLGSLGEFLSKLKEFGVDLNYIKVDTKNGKVQPYFSGTISCENKNRLEMSINGMEQKANLYTAYPHFNSKNANLGINSHFVGPYDIRLVDSDGGKVQITAKVPNYTGALADILQQIKSKQINLTSLEVFARGCESSAILNAEGVRV